MIHGKSFSELNPHDWLVWEAGALHVSRSNVGASVTVSQDLSATANAPRVGDPLCFVLADRSLGATVRIGRAEGNDVVLSDETVSRNHCTLVFGDDGWTATPSEEPAMFKLDGVEVPYGRVVKVSSGQTLTLGRLALSLVTTQGMVLRLAAKLARR